MTAPTTNGHRPRFLQRSNDGDAYGSGEYPRDVFDDVLDVDEAPTPEPEPEPDLDAQDTGRPRPTKHPILPAWAKSAGGIHRNARHVAPIALNRAIWYGFVSGSPPAQQRTMPYAVRPAQWVARGTVSAAAQLADLVVDSESLEAKRDARKAKNRKEVHHWRKERHRTRRTRGAWAAGILAVLGALGAVLTGPGTPAAGRLVLGTVVLVVLGTIGRRDGASAPSTPAISVREDPATSLVRTNRVVKVFDDAGFKEVMTVGGVRRRDHGAEGWEAAVDLQRGTTVDEVQGRHLKLCSAWGVGRERLYLQRGAHEGQVHLTLFDEDPMTVDPVRTPLRDRQTRSLWDPVPIGTTAYGDPYSLVLPGTSGVWICSAPGYGKTNLLLLLLAAANLGIRVLTFIHDGKGEGDLEPYRALATHFSQGSNDAAGRDCLRMLTAVRDLKTNRTSLIRRVRAERPDLMPSSQITREVTEDPQWDLPLVLVLVDELNLMVKTESGDKIQAEVCGIAEGCRSGGIIPVIAGQNFRAGVLDGAQASIGTRVAFKTNTPADSNMILGAGQVGEGFNTSRWPDNYQGVAIVRPAGRQVQSGTHQVKVHLGEYADHVAIAAHAGRQRIAAGGVVLAKTEGDLLGRVLDAMGDADVVPVDDIATGLGMDDVEVLVDDLRHLGVPVKPSRGHGNRRAVRRRDVVDRM